MQESQGFADSPLGLLRDCPGLAFAMWASSQYHRSMSRRLSLFLILSLSSPGPAAAPEGDAFFEAKIRPVLVEHCYECHSAKAKKLRGGLRLDTRDGMRKGGDTGPAVVPGRPEKS